MIEHTQREALRQDKILFFYFFGGQAIIITKDTYIHHTEKKTEIERERERVEKEKDNADSNNTKSLAKRSGS